MAKLLIAAVALVHVLLITAQPYLESIIGAGLIGSHFGAPFFNASFDYVIIGGGTAGLTLATRLAQNASNTVAVIEAGGFAATDNGNFSSIPAFNGYWIGKSTVTRNPLGEWETYTEPLPGFGGQKILYSAGKTLGGGSTRNSLTYHRSVEGAFKKWASEVGDNSYEWNNLLPYFMRSVEFKEPRNDIRPANASTTYDLSATSKEGGPLKVSYPNHANAYSTYGIKALNELGLRDTKGSISGKLIGYAYTANSIDRETQTRSSSETSFLRYALERTTNLNVYKSTLAKKILFNGTQATGVVVDTAGVQYVLSAAKEVIVSAGALRSPQILMVSGVGPKDKLESLGIPVVADRPGVGQNMQDHVLFGASYEVNLETHSRVADPLYAIAQVGAYLTNRTGALTNTGTELLGWEKLPHKYRAKLSNETQKELDRLPKDWPDLELIFPDGYGGDFQEFGAAPQDGKNYASVGMGLQSLFSRGNVTIKSSDSADHPVVNPNLLGDPRDVDVAVQAVHRIREIASTKAMKKVIIGKEAYPGETVASDADIKAWLQKAANTIYHASSTNKMGKKDDKLAVVDSEAKVIGVEGLRVVDASAFPFLPPGHPQSLVYALAEKISEAIQK